MSFIWFRNSCIPIFIVIPFLIGTLIIENSQSGLENLNIPMKEQFHMQGKILNIQKKTSVVPNNKNFIPNKKETFLIAEVKDNHFKYNVLIYGSSKGSFIYSLQGATISFNASRSKDIFPRNPGEFNYMLHLKSKGFAASLTTNINSVKIINSKKDPLSKINIFRQNLSEHIMKNCGHDTGALIISIISGDKSFLSPDITEDFKKSGIAHILSVSGLHIGILYIFMLKLFRNKKNKLFFSSITVTLFFYIVFCSFSPSVVRAGSMIFIHIAACIFKRPYDMLTAGSWVFTAMLFFNPFCLFNIGFQLSFLGVFSIAVIYPFLNHLIYGSFEKLNDSISKDFIDYMIFSVSLQIGLSPYIAYHFCYFSFLSLAVNPLAIAVISIMLPLSLCLIIFYFLFDFLFIKTLNIAEIIGEFLLDTVSFISNLSFSSVDICAPHSSTVILYYGIILIISSEYVRILFKRKNFSLISIFLCMVLALSFSITDITGEFRGNFDVLFADVGQGDCVIIKTPSGKTLLADGGGRYGENIASKTLKPLLLKNGIRKIDLALVSHIHEDHYGGVRDLTKIFPVEKVAFYEANIYREKKFLKEMNLQPENIIFLKAGDSIQIEKNLKIDFIYPFKKSSSEYQRLVNDKVDENILSLVSIISYEKHKIIITGDIGFEQEKEIINHKLLPKCDILKVCHHGSRYSSSPEFISALSPEIAIIQCGKNFYGHPSPDVIKRLKSSKIEVKRNDTCGAVSITDLSQTDFKFKTMIDLQ